MSIGILYESDEWSNRQIEKYLHNAKITTEYIYVENLNPDKRLSHNLYVNRVFPSASMRGNINSIKNTFKLLKILEDLKITAINSLDAFIYDCSKINYYTILKKKGIKIPKSWYINYEKIKSLNLDTSYPFVLKKNCGGRSLGLYIIWNKEDFFGIKDNLTGGSWILQEYIEPFANFTTRVEVIGNDIMVVLKRFTGRGGISSYSAGSKYEIYKDCTAEIIEDSLRIMRVLKMEMGSVDFIETKNRGNYVIDVNSTSNFTPDYIPLLGFNPIEKMTDFIIDKYNSLRRS